MRTAHSIIRLITVVYFTLPVPLTIHDMPLNTAYIHWLRSITHTNPWAKSSTGASSVNILSIGIRSIINITPNERVISPETAGIIICPSRRRFIFPAPKFCPEKVVAAADIPVMAMFAIPVTLPEMEHPAMITEPWELTSPCIAICPKEKSELLSPMGSPIPRIFLISLQTILPGNQGSPSSGYLFLI